MIAEGFGSGFCEGSGLPARTLPLAVSSLVLVAQVLGLRVFGLLFRSEVFMGLVALPRPILFRTVEDMARPLHRVLKQHPRRL